MSTQVSIWFITVPIVCSKDTPKLDSVWHVTMYTLMPFTIAGLALWFWNMSEYTAKKFETERKAHHAEVQYLLRKILIGTSTQPELEQTSTFTRADFESLLHQIEYSCDDIGCKIRKRECRMRTTSQAIKAIVDSQNVPPLSRLEVALEVAVPQYFRRLSREGTMDRGKCKDEAFAMFQEFIQPKPDEVPAS